MSPQDVLAMMTVEDRKTEQENANVVGDDVGHRVTADEAEKIKAEANDFGQRYGKINETRAIIARLAEKLGLYKGPNGWTGKAESGTPVFRGLQEHATSVDDDFFTLQQQRTMDMLREPSAALQERFAQTSSRPEFDDMIPGRLNRLEQVLNDIETTLRGSYDQDVLLHYTAREQRKAETARSRGAAGPYKRRTDATPTTPKEPAKVPTFRAE